MATRTILKITIIYLQTVAQLFGVWPYFYNQQKNIFKTTWYLKLIPIAACIFFTLGMLHSVIILFFESPNVVDDTDAAQFIKNMFSLTSVLMFFVSYKFPYIDKVFLENLTKLFHGFFIKANVAVNEIDSNYKNLLYMCIIKSALLPAIYVITDNFKLDEIAKPARTNPMLKCFLILPIWIFGIVPNLFLMGMMVVLYYFRQMNVKLREIVRKTVSLSKDKTGRRNYHMKWFCELSDEVDAVSVLHMELCDLVKLWNRLFSVPVCLWIYYKVIFLLLQLFFNYVVVGTWLKLGADPDNFNSSVVLCSGTVEILMTMLELTILVHICFSCEKEVGNLSSDM